MQLDRKSLNRLLSLNDRQLQIIIEKLASEYGLDLSAFNITDGDIASVRRAIANLTDDELRAIAEQVSGGGKK